MKGSTMYHLKRSLQYSLMILFVSVYLVACQSVTPSPLNGAPMPGISLNITGSTCPSLNATTSDRIAWTNQDQQVHLIHIESSDGKIVFDSGDLQPGDTASFTISEAGNYVYVCSSDLKSTGTITVEP
jgi:hypothetical protein